MADIKELESRLAVLEKARGLNGSNNTVVQQPAGMGYNPYMGMGMSGGMSGGFQPIVPQTGGLFGNAPMLMSLDANLDSAAAREVLNNAIDKMDAQQTKQFWGATATNAAMLGASITNSVLGYYANKDLQQFQFDLQKMAIGNERALIDQNIPLGEMNERMFNRKADLIKELAKTDAEVQKYSIKNDAATKVESTKIAAKYGYMERQLYSHGFTV